MGRSASVVVATTGRQGGRWLGEALAAELSRVGAKAPEAVADVEPVTSVSRLAERLAGSVGAVVVHLPCRAQPDPGVAAAVAEVTATAGARLLLVSSTEVYEPSNRQPGLVGEDGAGPRSPDHPVARRWWQLERSAAEAAQGTAPVILRAAPVPAPGGGDWASRLLSGRHSRTLPGFDPPLQLLALPDLAAGVAQAVEVFARGGGGPEPAVYNLVPSQPVPLAWALRLAGVRRMPWPLPWSVGGPAAGGARNGTGGGGWRYLAYPWTASGRRASEDLGFSAAHSSAQVAAAMAAGDGWRPDAAWWAGHGGGPTRVTGPAAVDLSFDEHGLSPAYIGAFSRSLFPFLHDVWWRVEHRGVERVPRQGAAVLVGVHRGFMPWDGVMALHLLRREVGRLPRFLVHPSLVKFPFLSNFMRRLGGIFAAKDNADLVLEREGLLAIFPEGIRGAFRRYRGVYELGNFGRRDYVRLALAHGAPILPFVTVGSAEIYPILGRVDWSWCKRLTEWPFLPLTPTFPWFPVPLPSKWHTHFLEPVEIAGRWSPEQADDPVVVAEIGDLVEARMQAAIDRMLERRRSWWRGSVFGPEESARAEAPASQNLRG